MDSSMSIGVKGMIEIIRRKFEGVKEEDPNLVGTVVPWKLNIQSNVVEDAKERGVENLPNYTFLQDATKLYIFIKDYVANTVSAAYTPKKSKRHESTLGTKSFLVVFKTRCVKILSNC